MPDSPFKNYTPASIQKNDDCQVCASVARMQIRVLDQWCLTRQKPLYGLTPKLHAMSHFRHDLDLAFASGKQVFRNPAGFDCGVSEDFVGRVSRQSRRIAFKRRTFVQQLLMVYKLKVRFVLTDFLKKRLSPPLAGGNLGM